MADAIWIEWEQEKWRQKNTAFEYRKMKETEMKAIIHICLALIESIFRIINTNTHFAGRSFQSLLHYYF